MHRQTWQLAAEICAIVAIAWPASAQAYQTVKVGPSGATVFANPRSDSSTTGTLRAGQAVNIGDAPKDGFYRASAAGGISGWVQEDALVMPPPAQQVHHVVASPDQGLGQSSVHGGGTDRGMISFGALGGLGIAGGGASMGFGVDAGYKVNHDWGVGLYFEYLGLASATSAASSSGTSTTGLAGASLLLFASEFNYYVPKVEGLFVGGKVGFGIASFSATNTVTSLPASSGGASSSSAGSSTFMVAGALAAGYDYPIMPMLSVGGETNCFFVSGGNGSTVVDLLGSVKFNF